MTTERWLIKDSVSVRPDDDGGFDELMVYETRDGERWCSVHAEMMDDGCLWVGIYPKDASPRRVCMWINAKKGKLRIQADED